MLSVSYKFVLHTYSSCLYFIITSYINLHTHIYSQKKKELCNLII